MKLRLVSRLMVLTLVVVVGVIIIIHERAAVTRCLAHRAAHAYQYVLSARRFRGGWRPWETLF